VGEVVAQAGHSGEVSGVTQVSGARLAELLGLVGDEGDDIDQAEAGVHAAVFAQIEALDGDGGQSLGGGHHDIDRAGQGEDGAMVVGIAVRIEEGGCGGGAQGSQNNLVTTLADVDHTLDDHAASLPLLQTTDGVTPAGR
jgi:hypothetical protein